MRKLLSKIIPIALAFALMLCCFVPAAALEETEASAHRPAQFAITESGLALYYDEVVFDRTDGKRVAMVPMIVIETPTSAAISFADMEEDTAAIIQGLIDYLLVSEEPALNERAEITAPYSSEEIHYALYISDFVIS